MPNQYYVTSEIKPNGDIDVIRIEGDYGVLDHAHRSARDHVMFLRSVGQRHGPHGKLETKPLLCALAAWPLAVLKTTASMRYGTTGQETDDMSRGLRPIADADGLAPEQSGRLIAAVNRCALNKANDNDRVLLARSHEDGDRMLGPCELAECDKHPGYHKLHRWTWHVPEGGDHLSALQCGDVGSVSACPMCLQAEIEASQPAMGLKVKMVGGEAVLDGNGRTRVKAAIAANRVLRTATKRPMWCELAAVILRHVPSSLECGAIERSPANGHWLRLSTSDEYDFIVDIDWRSGVLSMAEIDEGGEVYEAMKTRRAKVDDAAIGPTVAGWLNELVAEFSSSGCHP